MKKALTNLVRDLEAILAKAKKKLAKSTVKAGHKRAKGVARSRGHKSPTSSDYAVGMASAKKSARKRKKSR